MESLTNLFKKNTPNTNTPDTKPKAPEKSQEELRRILEDKINSSRSPIEELIKEYQTSLKDGTFDDQEDEEEGKGEERKIIMQEKLNSMMDRVEKMKERLDSGEPLPSHTEEISSTYTFTNKDGKVEKTEQITINIEQKLNEYISFYKSHGLEIPDDFEEQIREIWNNNLDEIEKEIEAYGFNEILLIPPTTDLPDLAEKMKETTYYEGNNFREDGSFEKAKSQNQDKVRLILAHNAQNLKDHPELAKTLNIRGQDVPLDQTLSLEEYLILSKKYFEETGKHLDEYGATWLSTESGSRLVASDWGSSFGLRGVHAHDFSYQGDRLGFRSSRSFTR